MSPTLQLEVCCSAAGLPVLSDTPSLLHLRCLTPHIVMEVPAFANAIVHLILLWRATRTAHHVGLVNIAFGRCQSGAVTPKP